MNQGELGGRRAQFLGCNEPGRSRNLLAEANSPLFPEHQG